MSDDSRTVRFVPPPPARDNGNLIVFTILAAVCAVLALVITEMLLIAGLRSGWLCMNPPASAGPPLTAVGSLDSSLLPPRAICTYPELQNPSITVAVNVFPAGTVAFWVSLAVLAACAVIGVRLHQRN